VRAPQIAFPVLVQDFFLRLLIAQRGASARTVEAYRGDGFELLLGYLEQRTGQPPSALCLADLDAPAVLDFPGHLETERGNSTRTRNARLAAIHSFMRHAALRDPASLPITARVLAMPAKRFDRPVLGYLSREQVAAILAAPDRGTWSGRRDAVLLATAYNRPPAYRRPISPAAHEGTAHGQDPPIGATASTGVRRGQSRRRPMNRLRGIRPPAPCPASASWL
jgi:integrase/recombinase XerD